MNDKEFASSISPEIGSLYREAKEYCAELPEHSLSRIRGLCHLVCNLIAVNTNLDLSSAVDLGQKITLLSDGRRINPRTRSNLHRLRVNGNKGAHPEKYFLSKEDFTALARDSLAVAREVLEVAHQNVFRGQVVPNYDASEPPGGNLRDICYRAMIGGEAEARYLAGKMLQRKAADLLKELRDQPRWSFVEDSECQSMVAQATFWFKLAAEHGHPSSMYEYGVALAEGCEGDANIARGEHLVGQASALGNADANAFIGDCFFHGSTTFEIDLVEARKCFELAAAEDHPRALANLGVMYKDGLGGPANPQAAYEYTRRSAEAGFPQGQYNLFVLHFNGDGIAQDKDVAIDWLKKAADQGYPTALLNLARLIVVKEVAGAAPSDAEELLLRCATPDVRNQASYELAELYLARADFDSLIKAANLLQQCYERERGDGELAQKCWELSPLVVKELKREFLSVPENSALLQSALIVLNYFNSDLRPVKCRDEQIKLFLEKANRLWANRHLGESERVALAGKLLLSDGALQAPPAKVLPFERRTQKVGRNDPCPCGSGKKYKHCCDLSGHP